MPLPLMRIDGFHGGDFLSQNSRADISCLSSQGSNCSLGFSTGNVGGAGGGYARLLKYRQHASRLSTCCYSYFHPFDSMLDILLVK